MGVRTFIKNGFIFLGLLLVLDVSLGYLLEYFYMEMKTGEAARTTFSLHHTHASTIVVGSSRATHHYIPSIIEKELGVTCYNTGRNGQGVLYYHGLIHAISSRYIPKMIILDLNPYDFDVDNRHYSKISCLAPYYNTNPEIRPILEERGPAEKLKLLSNLYRYNSFPVQILANTLIKRNQPEWQGYVPLSGSMRSDTLIASSYMSPLDSNLIGHLNAMIAWCKGKKIQLVVAISPCNNRMDISRCNGLTLVKRSCLKNKIPCLDYSQSELFLAKNNWFRDDMHLNHDGAEYYTKQICQDLKLMPF
ncbi:MAG: hypothetical protein MUF42_00630 [Cytophagaceae bacterium]|nr:hypothetical protein [Cytophagaceae bacterium]